MLNKYQFPTQMLIFSWKTLRIPDNLFLTPLKLPQTHYRFINNLQKPVFCRFTKVVLLSPSSKIFKKSTLKTFSIFFKKKFFLYFGKWNFLALRLKRFLFFLKKKLLIFREMELFKKPSYISGGNFPSSNNTRTCFEKISYTTFLPF